MTESVQQDQMMILHAGCMQAQARQGTFSGIAQLMRVEAMIFFRG
jgi:hypothetical protein